tara:strand:- start:210 stop:395 length:186 start_codon:yes stop_codon:yes gene_type:complete
MRDREEPNDLWQDMETLNTLYEELCWAHNDVLEFVPDFENNRIIIKNKTHEEKYRYWDDEN